MTHSPLRPKGLRGGSRYPGFLTLGSSYSLRLPIQMDSGCLQISSPITVADQWQILPHFPEYVGYGFTTRHGSLCTPPGIWL